jgi:hypothetical protein
MSAGEGTIYYTIDGTDPRLMSNAAGSDFVIVREDKQKYVLIPQAYVSLIWRSSPVFDVADWLLCTGKPGGVGYDRESGYHSYFSLDVQDEMYSKNTSCYIRIPFDFSANMVDSLKSMTLRIRYDDGFIAYLNGTEVARVNFTGNPHWNSSASSQNPDENAVILENIDISEYISKLKDGTNILAIHGMNEGAISSDFLISVELTGQKKNDGSTPASISPNAIQYSGPFALNQTAQIKSRVYADGEWSALTEAVFALPFAQNNIIISELHYHPLAEESIDDTEFEFIEMQNAGNETQNLSFARFVKGVNYVFPANTVLRPSEYLVLASDKYYFTLRYGFSPFGVYSGQLDNAGERIALVDASGDTLISFLYDDHSPWPESADGHGYSLVLNNAELEPDYDDAASWHASEKMHGEPGGENVFVRPHKEASLPASFALMQNYPNPFNSSTMIAFRLPTESFVQLKVFDIMGREVATLMNEKLAAGTHSYKWDAVNISSGVYFYRLTTNTDYVQTKKLLFLK